MLTPADLRDMHARTHAGTIKLLRHCRKLTLDELHRELPGFGFPTVHLQLYHTIDTELYWIGVLQGRLEVADNRARFADVKALEAFRKRVAEDTTAYLGAVSATELNTPVRLRLWTRSFSVLAPAQVVLRVLTHAFHHRGQVAAMCRLLGQPTPSLDYPLRA
jgi:uncharacterized damage-inducible protein DinB